MGEKVTLYTSPMGKWKIAKYVFHGEDNVYV